MKAVRVRFAPSPTGYMHIGSLRTALYNYLFAKHHQGVFILRIEDTDQSRFVEGAVENIISTLNWAGIPPDEGPEFGGAAGPYLQSQRLELYKKHAYALVQSGHAYYAFDSAEEIEAMRQSQKARNETVQKYDRHAMKNSLTLGESEWRRLIENGTPYVIRLKVPENVTIAFDDLIRGSVRIDTYEIDDQILLKSDGFPTYHLANVVDDHFMEITHVIRGEEWLSSVPKHVLLYQYFNWQMPILAHLPLIKNPDGSKMSKRDGLMADEHGHIRKVDADVSTYIKAGYEKEALLNYIALLGWNPGEGDERQIFSLADLVHEFSLERVNKAGAIFDLEKLRWLNGEHLRMRSDADIADKARQVFIEHQQPVPADDYLLAVVRLMKTRIRFVSDIVTVSSYFFTDPTDFDEKGVNKSWKPGTWQLMSALYTRLSDLASFTAPAIETVLNQVAEETRVSASKLIHPTRLILTGVTAGPGLFELMEVLGQAVVLKRFQRGLQALPKI